MEGIVVVDVVVVVSGLISQLITQKLLVSSLLFSLLSSIRLLLPEDDDMSTYAVTEWLPPVTLL